MPESTTVLISLDARVIKAVREVTHAIPNLQLEVLPTLDRAAALLDREDVALVLADLKGADDALALSALLRAVAAAQKPIPTVALSNRYEPEMAIALLRQGAVDYLTQPLDLDWLAYLINALTLRCRVRRARSTPTAVAPRVRSLGDRNPLLYLAEAPMEALIEQVKRVAPQEATVLLTGETGTGKTLLARLIHDLSPRRAEPFLVINCGALSPTLIESELFGHEKGAFTGADRARTGKFTDAGCGTLVLDEVDALPPAMQAKLLRAVEERLFEPVGSNQTQVMRARVIAATNRVLEDEVVAGRFREDLFYRLNVVAFYLPPLRERPGLVRALVDQFVGDFATRTGRPIDGLHSEALDLLERYPWPGNVRELRNTIERAVVLCPGTTIQVKDLPEVVRAAGLVIQPLQAVPEKTLTSGVAPLALPPAEKPAATLAETKEAAEAKRITVALRKHNNNKLRAAEELGISRMTLYKKLHRYNLMTLASA